MTILMEQPAKIEEREEVDGEPRKVSLDETLVKTVLFSERPRRVPEKKTVNKSPELKETKEFLKSLICEAFNEVI